MVSIVFLLTAFSVNVVSAKEVSIEVVSTEFNTATVTQHNLNTTFTSLYMLNITDKLDFNTTTTTANASIFFYHVGNVSEYINFLFNGTYFYIIGVSNNETVTLLDNSTYTSDVSVWCYEGNASVYVDDVSTANMTSFTVFDTSYFNCSGATNLINSTSGNVTVYSGTLPLGRVTSYQIGLIIPIVIAFAVITMMVKMIDKMGKKLG